MSFLDEWKAWSTPKKAISIIVVCCIGLIIVGAIVGALSPDQNTVSTPSSSDSDDNSNQASTPSSSDSDDNSEQASGVQIRIIYDGSWQGAAGSENSMNSISGSGDETIDMDNDARIISANAQKTDSGSGTLTIQILKDGKVIEESSTDAEYGVASVSATV